ncbi:MAG: hypothetical protein L6Q99_07430 [Planctomycetes bacterium]|nr:hypothetical protein [Planctomycetota bacterium]
MFNATHLTFALLATASTTLAQSADLSATAGTGNVHGSFYGAPTDAPFVYTNGPYITGIGNGIGGADTSIIETGWNTFGYGIQGGTTNNRIADDFVVPNGQNWTLTKLHWLGYQTGAPTSGSITGVQVNLWNTLPVTGGTPMWTSAANVFVGASWTGVYRVLSVPGDNQRAIIDVVADLAGAPVLAPGTYWVDVQLVGSASFSGPWAPPTVPHLVTDNGRQFTGATATWQPTADTSTGLPQDFPFGLEGDDGVSGCLPATTYCVGKVNSLGCTPAISLAGSVSFSAGSGALLSVTNVLGGVNGEFFHGTAGAANTPFFGGTLCVQPPLVRHTLKSTGGTWGSCSGFSSEDFNTYIASGADPALVAGAQVWIQHWSRDPNLATNRVGLSNAATVVICP